MSLSLASFREAQSRIAPYIVKTPLLRLPNLDEALGCEVYVKAECMQKTGAFKLRGAMNKLLSLSPEDLAKGVKGAQIIIEAVPEVEEIKRTVLRQISDLADEGALIATNSSYMVSSKFVDCVKDPSRLANMHFYNPALVMKFVEVVQGPHTSEETARTLYEFAKATGKEPIWMKKEIAGFAANYIISGIYERARHLVAEGYCSYEDVDKACELGLGHPMGPFRLNDLTGIDLAYDIMKAKYEKTGEKPECFDLYEKLYKEGRLGRKTGHGFYDYE